MPFKFNPLTGELDYYEAAGAGGSVTSAEVSAVSAQAASTKDVVSNALSNEISNRVSADTVLSAALRLDYVSVANAVSVAAVADARSALSVHSALHSAISAHSDATSVKGLQSAIDLIVNRVSVNSAVAGGASTGTSAAVIADARSAIAVLSVDTSANITSQVAAHSTTQKNDIASVSAAIMLDARSALSVHSAILSNISVKNSAGTSVRGLQSVIQTLSNRASTASAAATSADAHAAAASAAATSVKNEASAKSSALSQALSVADAKASNRSSAVSAAVTSVDTRLNTLSGLHSALSQVVSVMSTKVSQAAIRNFTWLISAPATGGQYGTQLEVTSKALKVVVATISASTAIVANVEKRPTFGAAGSNVLSADITGSVTPVSAAADTSAGAATITAGSWIYLDISGVSGSPVMGIVKLTITQPT